MNQDANYIIPIDEEVLRYCWPLPRKGVEVRDDHGNCRVIHPAGKSHIGTYTAGNGRVVFVNTDGNTYVAREYWIIPILNRAGFAPSRVPIFSIFASEKINDRQLDDLWALTKAPDQAVIA